MATLAIGFKGVVVADVVLIRPDDHFEYCITQAHARPSGKNPRCQAQACEAPDREEWPR
jgi:hypothetical protein